MKSALPLLCAIVAIQAQTYPVVITFPFVDFAAIIGDPLGEQALKFAGRVWQHARNTTTLGFNDISSIAIRPIEFGQTLQVTLGCASSQASRILAAMAESELCVRMGGDQFCTDALPPTTEGPDIIPTAAAPKKVKFYQRANFMYYAIGTLAALTLLLLVLLYCCYKRKQKAKNDDKDFNRFRDRVTHQIGEIDMLVASDSLPSSVT